MEEEDIMEREYENDNYEGDKRYDMKEEERIKSAKQELKSTNQQNAKSPENITLKRRQITNIIEGIAKIIEIMDGDIAEKAREIEEESNNKEKEEDFPLNKKVIEFINMLRMGRIYNTNNQSKFKTMVNVCDEEIKYMPQLHTHEESDLQESEIKSEKENQIHIIHVNKGAKEERESPEPKKDENLYIDSEESTTTEDLMDEEEFDIMQKRTRKKMK